MGSKPSPSQKGRESGLDESKSTATVSCPLVWAQSRTRRQLPEGRDYGFLWRLNAYWRYVPVQGGVLVECESLALSLGVPSVLRPVAAPIIDTVSRESLENTLGALRVGFVNTR